MKKEAKEENCKTRFYIYNLCVFAYNNNLFFKIKYQKLNSRSSVFTNYR